MAVQTGNQQQAAQAKPAVASPAVDNSKPFNPQMIDWSFGQSVTGPIGNTLPDDQLFTLVEKMGELIKKHPSADSTLQVIPVDGNVAGLYYSAVVATMTESRTPGRKAFYTFVLTETNAYPKPDTETWNGQQIQVDVTPDQLYDNVYAERVLKVLTEQDSTSAMVNAGGTLVGAVSSDNVAQIQKLLQLASVACATALVPYSERGMDINLSKIPESFRNGLNTDITFSTPITTDQVGAPVRTDFNVSFYWQPNNKPAGGRVSRNDTSRAEVFGSLGGFVDFAISNGGQQTNGWGQTPAYTAPFVARAVITHLQTDAIATLPATLLQLASIAGMEENSNWMHSVYARAIGTRSMQSNPSILRVIANPGRNANGMGEYVDVMTDTALTNGGFADLIKTCARPELIYSLDVPLLGATSFALDIFRTAASGTPAAIRAQEDILAAADVLTNGHMSKLYDKTKPMFVDLNNIVLLGHYTDDAGVVSDIRDVDLLAMANTFIPQEQSFNMVQKYTMTQYGNEHISKRLRDRREMIEAMCGARVKFTGLASRVTPSTNFMQSLCRAIAANGVASRLNIPSARLSMQPQQGFATFGNDVVASALNGNGAAGMFQSRSPLASGNGNMAGTTFDRFSAL